MNISSIYNDRIIPLKQLKIVSDGYSNDLLITIQKLNNGAERKEDVIHELANIKNRINNNWKEYLATYLTIEEKEQVKRTEVAKKRADQLLERLSTLIETSPSPQSEVETNQIIQTEFFPIMEPVLKEINGLVEIQISESNNLKNIIKSVFIQIKILSLLFLFLFFVIFWFTIYRRKLEKIIFQQSNELAFKNEELSTANEELQTNIEELDVTNEELITTNEELSVVNEQLNQYKNELERLVAERSQALSKSEARFKGIFDNAYDAIILLKDGHFIDCNARTLDMFECSRLDFIGKTPLDFSPEEQVTGKLSKDWFEELLKQAQDGYIQLFQWMHFKYASKQAFEVEISLNKLELHGEILIQAIVRDITERKRNEAELAKAQSILNATFESTEDLIFAVDTFDFRILALNTATKIFYSKANISVGIGTKIEDMFVPEKIIGWKNYFQKVLEGVPFETEYTDFDKSNVFVLSFYPLKNGDQIFGFSVFAKDITQMRQAEEQLRIHKYSIDIAQDSAYWIDSKGDFIYANESTHKKLGYSKDELLKLSIKDVNPNITAEKWGTILKQLREDGRYIAESVHRRKDGTFFPVEISTTYIKFNGKEYINGFAKDITERKQAEKSIKENEEHLQYLLDSVTDFIYSVKIENGIVIDTQYGEGCETVTGYSASEFKRNNDLWIDIVYPDDRELFLINSAKIIDHKIIEPFEYRITNKINEIVWVRNTPVLKYNLMHELVGYEGLITNISEHKKLEQQILTRVIETEERERMNFSQELHDGLGPLISSIKMYIELILLPDSKMDIREAAKNTAFLIEEASRTIREISFKLSPHILQNYGLYEALEAFSKKIRETKKIQIQLNCINLGRMNLLTETIIYRVICECVNNAIKHANAEMIKINISYVNNILEIAYHDNGIGFDVAEILNSKNGIGLLNMQSRIESLNGSMNIISNPENGTTIIFKVNISTN